MIDVSSLEQITGSSTPFFCGARGAGRGHGAVGGLRAAGSGQWTFGTFTQARGAGSRGGQG
eukprot:scaffold72298_cov28-Tisochrysis_lutea.AAC.1